MTQLPNDNLAASRGRKVLHASAAGAVFQGVYALSQFVILAVLLRYIGDERFGMWTTVWSIGAWALISHLGVQSALLTRLGQIATTDRGAAGRALTTSLVLVVVIAAGLIVLTLAFGWLIPWSALLNVQSAQAVSEAQAVCLVVLVMAFLGLPMSLGWMGLLGCQRGLAAYSALIGAHLLAASMVAVGVWAQWPLAVLAFLAMSPPIVAGLMQWGLLLRGPGALTPGPWDRAEAVGMLRIGLRFFVLQLMTIGLLQSGAIIIAQRLGAAAVTPYAAMFRLIGLVLAVFLSLGFAYWPAFADAAAHGDRAWFGRALRWSLVKTLGAWGVAAVGILLLGDVFIRWWLGPVALPGTALKVWMVVFVGLYGLLLWVTTPLKGVDRLGVQVVAGALMVGVSIPLAVWLCGRYGAAGVPIAQSLAIIAVGLPVNGLYLLRLVKLSDRLPTPCDRDQLCP